MNTRLLRRIAAKAIKYPETSMMEDYGKVVKVDKTHPCGAVGCIAGIAVLLTNPKRFTSIAKTKRFAVSQLWFHAGRKALGIDTLQANSLFSVNNWPIPFAHRYREARTHETRARILAQRIEFFIKTKDEQ